MNVQLKRLFEMTQRPSRRIIGLMSGTSLDGLDVALCRVTGAGTKTEITLEAFETVDYSDEIKNEIRTIFAKQSIDFQHLTLLNEWIGKLHGAFVNQCLEKWNIAAKDVDLVASHGQTVFHAPKILHQISRFDNATLQIGDGDHVAATTGIITLADFRQRHVAAGGEGAPLAVYGDFFIFTNENENRILLNMGGIANFTYLPKTGDAQRVFVTDTGTGNTLMDAVTRRYFPSQSFDRDAAHARAGKCDLELLNALKNDAFFDAPMPKTTGPELFNEKYVEKAAKNANFKLPKPVADEKYTPPVYQRICNVLATLVHFSAETIAQAIEKTIGENADFNIYMSGGGMHNPLLVETLKTLLPHQKFGKTDDLGINGDAKEAILFALLANECLMGGETNFGSREGVPSVTMGKICFPK
ncbi:MAG: hypothetical protein RL757_2694 [Bacteroidota bacterium]|jgi:anhydro-N-acetylmuramic acid kinase